MTHKWYDTHRPKPEEGTVFLRELMNAPIKFGLEVQGHIPTIETMLREGKSWDEIGKVIGWHGLTAKDHYERWLQRSAKWRSIAVWPNTIRVGHVVGKNESDDTHKTREAAEAVCNLLVKHGFGGEGKVFPLSTRVEPISTAGKPPKPDRR